MESTIIQIAFSALVAILKATGVLNPLEAEALKDEHAVFAMIQHLKTYSKPTDFPDAPPGDLTPNNLGG